MECQAGKPSTDGWHKTLFLRHVLRAREVQGDCVFDDIGEIERKLLVGEITSDVARTLIWSKQWRAAKLAQKRYGDKLDTSGTVILDMSDRIIARWKENLAELNRTDPLPPKTIEGQGDRCDARVGNRIYPLLCAGRRDAAPDRNGACYGAERLWCGGISVCRVHGAAGGAPKGLSGNQLH